MVVSDAEKPWPPCGFCRQVIAEFATPKTLIHTANLQGAMKTFTFADIFPEAFTPDHLD
ncbi:Cytidine deaminase [compost metagenome]